MDKFEEWRRQNPSKPFKEFFAERVERKLRDGRPHPTLGGNLCRKEHGTSGRGYFKRLVKIGLKPDDVCVDYGCGTLRLGIHAINYLEPGAYWGMDVSEFLLEEGRRLIGDRLTAEKQPHLRVISADSVAEVAAVRVAMLISVKVLVHVHPDELLEYFQNIIKIIGPSGQAIIDAKWSHTTTVHYGERSWVHAISTIQDLVRVAGGSMGIIEEQEYEIVSAGLTERRGTLRIVQNGALTRQ